MKTKILTIACLAFLATAIVSCGAEPKKVTKKIEVTGSAEMEITPNEIYMTFSLKEYLKGGKKVKLAEIKTKFLEACKKMGISKDDVSISSYAGNERWDYYWYVRRKREPDFMASISYAVKVNSAEKLDQLIDAVDEEALSHFNITKTSHSDIEKFRKEVKTDAMKASRDKAIYLAESVDEEVGETISIKEIENAADPYYYGNRYSNEYSNVSYQLDLGQNETQPSFKKIKIRYEIKAKYRLE